MILQSQARTSRPAAATNKHRITNFFYVALWSDMLRAGTSRAPGMHPMFGAVKSILDLL
jgi:hypothetical protein